jgi:hypothetical protein
MEPNGRGAADASLGGRKWPCHAGATNLQDRFWRDADLLMLFKHTPTVLAAGLAQSNKSLAHESNTNGASPARSCSSACTGRSV